MVTHESFRTLFDLAEADDHEDSERLDINNPEDRAAAMERWFAAPSPWGGRRAGPSPEFLERIRSSGGSAGSGFATPRPTVPLVDGQTIKLARREWVAMHTPGHTYDHLCLYDPEFGVVLTGDHVLPSITPHISGLTPNMDPLATVELAGAAAFPKRFVRGLTDETPRDGPMVKIAKTYAGNVIQVKHVGSYQSLSLTHRKIIAYLAAHGIERNGPTWESYVSDPGQVAERDLLTYVYYPILVD